MFCREHADCAIERRRGKLADEVSKTINPNAGGSRPDQQRERFTLANFACEGSLKISHAELVASEVVAKLLVVASNDLLNERRVCVVLAVDNVLRQRIDATRMTR